MRLDKEVGTSSDFMYRSPRLIPMPCPMAPPISILRPTMSGPRVLFIDPRIPITRMGGYRPEGSMGVLSGHLTIRVPTQPLPLTPSHTPILTLGFRPRGSMGVPTRHKTRPSHFQKWVKKFNGSKDPYNHLASFRHLVRVGEVPDLHVLKEGSGLAL